MEGNSAPGVLHGRLARSRCDVSQAEQEISDADFKQAYIISSDPEQHADRIREIERMGPTTICLQNGSGADPHAALRVYGEKVLPALRGASVFSDA
jgi:alkanesulfonate monooxygenase SsuD/methylene tetrahydromethanopterin reductase-like flavin-dependent oxidoreductase (luciferase family)